MDSRPVLIFDLDGERFGLDATRVCESVWLPELAPVEEAPPWIVGLFNLRGRITPVADLHLRFGRPSRRYSPEDQVIVLETDHHQTMGLIVSTVCEVSELSEGVVQPPPQFDDSSPASAHLVMGEARVGDDLVALLDVSRLTHLPEVTTLAAAGDLSLPSEHFCPEATPEERLQFKVRAAALRKTSFDEGGARLGLAVVELGDEYFGVELAAVQEFCAIAQLSPIPCCPPHVLGAMNLRGDLITLIDPRAALNLAPAAESASKAVVAKLGMQAVGIVVDEVHDVVYLRDEGLSAPPAALRERCGAEVMGTASYAGRTMIVLDLPALLAREEWVVDEK